MQEYMDKIRSTVLFKGFLEHEVLAALHCLQGTVKDYARKDVIFEQEALLDSAGIILYGNVLLCKENISGTRLIFSELESGDILGETALRLAQEPSGYEAVAGSDCRILFIQISKIIRPGRQTCQLRARIIENMMALLLENNRAVYQKLDLVSHKSLRERVLHYLSLQAQKNNSLSFEIPFSRSDLADYLTVDRSALSRELQRMAQDGLITISRNRFELLAEDVLMRTN
ncbi:Crp/Fnr family transcriptional regulator [Paenibacillus sp. FSL R7-0331]|uniref:Crp/Fnr family transcriptional regulator n=1 Tax=Paenibacillus sp. FSL R7-0331 TaxID=1536773 RepID=UPI0004F5F479|nr:Crp/Fnr family transcriptional regulator [Paenibacillus sp. FSL R7-0331]AIQ52482.1 hypothetical protein R70331_13810 [Paenibacillus sp. FSL R7-0331]